MRLMRSVAVCCAILLVPTMLAAQQSERLDSTAWDSVQRLEPAPGINLYIGAEVGWRALR